MNNLFRWMIAIALMVLAILFQRGSGPTKPQTVALNAYNQIICPKTIVRVPQEDSCFLAVTPKFSQWTPEKVNHVVLYYKRYPTEDTYQSVPAQFTERKQSHSFNEEAVYQAKIPVQPTAGKIAYYVEVDMVDSIQPIKTQEIILRFRDSVPAVILILHIVFMYLALLLAVYTGLYAFNGVSGNRFLMRYVSATLLAYFIGGFILGPLVQHYAFGVYWSGWPLGGDLTDNKTLVAFLVWLCAWVPLLWKKIRGNQRVKYLILAATVVTLVIFTIPHSARGSEYDYQNEQLAK